MCTDHAAISIICEVFSLLFTSLPVLYIVSVRKCFNVFVSKYLYFQIQLCLVSKNAKKYKIEASKCSRIPSTGCTTSHIDLKVIWLKWWKKEIWLNVKSHQGLFVYWLSLSEGNPNNNLMMRREGLCIKVSRVKSRKQQAHSSAFRAWNHR